MSHGAVVFYCCENWAMPPPPLLDFANNFGDGPPPLWEMIF